MSYYIGKTTYMEEGPNGLAPTRQLWLVDALAFTEAEAMLTANFPSNVSAIVNQLRPVKIAEVIEDPDIVQEVWYDVRMVQFTVNERTGKVRKSTSTIYLQADENDSMTQVCTRLADHLKTSLVPFHIESIRRTAIETLLSTPKPESQPC